MTRRDLITLIIIWMLLVPASAVWAIKSAESAVNYTIAHAKIVQYHE